MLEAKDLLFSVSALLKLQRAQAGMEGRDFTEEDAMNAVRPALESVLDELLKLQDGPKTCPHCKAPMTVTEDDLPLEDYESMDVQDIIDSVDDLETEDLQMLHSWEKKHQNRGSILSAITARYGSTPPADDEEAAEVAESRARKLDNMFDDVFSKMK